MNVRVEIIDRPDQDVAVAAFYWPGRDLTTTKVLSFAFKDKAFGEPASVYIAEAIREVLREERK